MNGPIPRVAAIHDLSGFGRCSLTVIIPVLSSMGIQVCPLPTAILSTHSGGFGNFYSHDLTDSMTDYASHWENTGIRFDCLYTGYLGSVRQVDIVSGLFGTFKKDAETLIVVDPVMGDNGRLYKSFTSEMQDKMRTLVQKADIITPNLTEACFLLGTPFDDSPMDGPKMEYYLRRLSEMGPDRVVITSVKTADGCFANIGWQRSTGALRVAAYDPVPAHYPGTGDIFTSVLTGSLLKGEDLQTAMDKAAQFVALAADMTYRQKTPEREGVLLEKALPRLCDESFYST